MERGLVEAWFLRILLQAQGIKDVNDVHLA